MKKKMPMRGTKRVGTKPQAAKRIRTQANTQKKKR